MAFQASRGFQALADFLVSVVFLAFQASQVSADIQGSQAILVFQDSVARQAFQE